jgi:hypothetical protein
MIVAAVGRIAGPRARADKVGPARDAIAAQVIVAARIEKRPPARGAERMADDAYPLPAPPAETVIAAEERVATKSAARRI